MPIERDDDQPGFCEADGSQDPAMRSITVDSRVTPSLGFLETREVRFDRDESILAASSAVATRRPTRPHPHNRTCRSSEALIVRSAVSVAVVRVLGRETRRSTSAPCWIIKGATPMVSARAMSIGWPTSDGSRPVFMDRLTSSRPNSPPWARMTATRRAVAALLRSASPTMNVMTAFPNRKTRHQTRIVPGKQRSAVSR